MNIEDSRRIFICCPEKYLVLQGDLDRGTMANLEMGMVGSLMGGSLCNNLNLTKSLLSHASTSQRRDFQVIRSFWRESDTC